MAKHDRETLYESVGEVWELVSNVADQRRAGSFASAKPAENGWDLGAGLEGAARMLVHGWNQHTDDVDETVQRELDKLQDRINKFNFEQTESLLDVSGSWVDVDRFISGEPECMWEQHMQDDNVNGRVLRIVMNCAASAFVSDAALVQRGASVVAAVTAAQAMGFNAELWVAEAVNPSGYGRSSNSTNVEMVKIKDYRDPIDMDVAMFCIAHPAMLRRVFFVLNEEHDEDHRDHFGFKPSGGYGKPSNLPTSITESFDLVIERYEYGQEKGAAELLSSIIVTDESERVSEYE